MSTNHSAPDYSHQGNLRQPNHEQKEGAGPAAGERQPLLGGSSDPESGYRAPYKPQNNKSSSRWLWAGVVVLGFVMFLLANKWTHAHYRSRPSNPYDPVDSAHWITDHCATFDTDGWEPFPSSDNIPHAPSHPPPEWSLFSTNVTFDLDFSSDADYDGMFASIYGSQPIATFFVDGHESDSEAATTSKSNGDQARITVETILALMPDERDIGDSEAFQRLQETNVCKRHHDAEQGVEIQTPPHPPHDHPRERYYPLVQYRYYVQLPKEGLRKLDLKGGAGDVYISDISDLPLDKLQVKAEAGHVLISDAVAGRVDARVEAGGIGGKIDLSEDLFVRVEAGDVHLDVGLVERDTRDGSNVHEESPVGVDITSESGSVDVKFVEWAQGLVSKQRFTSEAGEIKVKAHPRFEGDFYLSNNWGKIALKGPDSEETDPEGRGRTKKVSVDKHNTLGHSVWKGTAKWVEQKAQNEKDKKDSSMQVKATVGDIRVAF